MENVGFYLVELKRFLKNSLTDIFFKGLLLTNIFFKGLLLGQWNSHRKINHRQNDLSQLEFPCPLAQSAAVSG
jgi:hypothetical protein